MTVLLYDRISHHDRDDYRVPLPICDLSSRGDDDLPRVSSPHRDDPEIKNRISFNDQTNEVIVVNVSI